MPKKKRKGLEKKLSLIEQEAQRRNIDLGSTKKKGIASKVGNFIFESSRDVGRGIQATQERGRERRLKGIREDLEEARLVELLERKKAKIRKFRKKAAPKKKDEEEPNPFANFRLI